MREILFFLYNQPSRLVRDLGACGREALLLRRELLLAVHQYAVAVDLSLEGRFLLLEQFHDLLLPRGNLALAVCNLLDVGDRLRIAMRDVLLPGNEGVEAFHELLFARDELAFLRKDLLPRGIEFLVPLIEDVLPLF